MTQFCRTRFRIGLIIKQRHRHVVFDVRKLHTRTSGCGLDARRRHTHIYIYICNNMSCDCVQTRFDFIARQNVERCNKKEKKNRFFFLFFLREKH